MQDAVHHGLDEIGRVLWAYHHVSQLSRAGRDAVPVDEQDSFGPRELGDVVICPEHTEDLLEAVVHGVLHLTGMDHESDEGEMLALQAEIRSWL